jgi:hypothetical protein
MENKKVMVTSNAVGRVIINVPSMHFRREWERKGAKKPIEMEILREIFYDPGIEKMFRMGILYIEDMSVKIELDLEEEGTEKPINVVVLSDKERAELLSNEVDFNKFRESCEKLSKQELINLADYAIEKELINMDKCRYLKIKTGKDIIKIIENNKEE